VEDHVVSSAELAVAIADQEPWSQAAVVEVHRQVSRLLGHPGRIRMTRAGEVLDPARPHRDEEQHVQPLQPDGVDSEEVAGEDRVSVLARNDRQLEAPRSGAGGMPARASVSYQRRRDPDPELAQLADDPDIASVSVLARKSQDQLADRFGDRRPTRPSVRVRPQAGDDSSVQQRLGRDEERAPRTPRYYPAQRRQ
jgi:hypothetical protein